MAALHGRIGWHELLTTDTAGAVAFYTSFTGWATRPFELDPSYMLATVGGMPVAGFMALPEELEAQGVPPHWLVYMMTNDCAGTCARATSLGATVVHGPESVSGVGSFAVVKDPQGAAFALLQPEQDQPPADESVPGNWSWHELTTTSWEDAWPFYRNLFGWSEADRMDMGEMGTYFMFGYGGGPPVGGIYNIGPGMNVPPNWLPYVKVPSADATAARIGAGGGQILNGPMEVPGGDRIAQAMDPHGAAFAVHSAAPAGAQAPAPAPEPTPSAAAPATPAAPAAKSAAARKPTARKTSPRQKPAGKKPAKKPAASKKTVTRRPVKKKAAKRVTKRPVKKKAARKKAR